MKKKLGGKQLELKSLIYFTQTYNNKKKKTPERVDLEFIQAILCVALWFLIKHLT